MPHRARCNAERRRAERCFQLRPLRCGRARARLAHRIWTSESSLGRAGDNRIIIIASDNEPARPDCLPSAERRSCNKIPTMITERPMTYRRQPTVLQQFSPNSVNTSRTDTIATDNVAASHLADRQSKADAPPSPTGFCVSLKIADSAMSRLAPQYTKNYTKSNRKTAARIHCHYASDKFSPHGRFHILVIFNLYPFGLPPRH